MSTAAPAPKRNIIGGAGTGAGLPPLEPVPPVELQPPFEDQWPPLLQPLLLDP